MGLPVRKRGCGSSPRNSLPISPTIQTKTQKVNRAWWEHSRLSLAGGRRTAVIADLGPLVDDDARRPPRDRQHTRLVETIGGPEVRPEGRPRHRPRPNCPDARPLACGEGISNTSFQCLKGQYLKGASRVLRMREGAVPPPALAGEEVKGISIVDADEGIRVGAKRVARLMNADGVERDFTAEEPDQWGGWGG